MLQVNGIDHAYGLDKLHPNHKRDRCGGPIKCVPKVAAKKWPSPSFPGGTSRRLDVSSLAGHIQRKMVRINLMVDRTLRLDRRELMAGLAASALGPAMPATAAVQSRPTLSLQARAGTLALRPGGPQTPIWSLAGQAPDPGFRFKRGDELEITLAKQLPGPT